MIKEKEYAAMRYMLNQIYGRDMLRQLNDEGVYSYTIEEVRRCFAMIRNMCGL